MKGLAIILWMNEINFKPFLPFAFLFNNQFYLGSQSINWCQVLPRYGQSLCTVSNIHLKFFFFLEFSFSSLWRSGPSKLRNVHVSEVNILWSFEPFDLEPVFSDCDLFGSLLDDYWNTCGIHINIVVDQSVDWILCLKNFAVSCSVFILTLVLDICACFFALENRGKWVPFILFRSYRLLDTLLFYLFGGN